MVVPFGLVVRIPGSPSWLGFDSRNGNFFFCFLTVKNYKNCITLMSAFINPDFIIIRVHATTELLKHHNYLACSSIVDDSMMYCRVNKSEGVYLFPVHSPGATLVLPIN